ncbi:MAG: hypothetical protein J5J06_13865 [Phycisphaerae bacterium]|nr:hypothetical protein [Phycisphaerae bacterium]
MCLEDKPESPKRRLMTITVERPRYPQCRGCGLPKHSTVKQEKRDRVPFVTWARQGLIEMTPGNVVDCDVIRQRLNELDKLCKMRDVPIDPWNATQLATQLDDDHFEVVQFGQGSNT